MDTKIINQISSDENDYLDKLHKIVLETFQEEERHVSFLKKAGFVEEG